jgi:hypothetical protein
VLGSQRHHATRRKYDCEALLAVLCRFMGWRAATSGIEQNFSQALRALGPQRSNALAPDSLALNMRFAVYKCSEEEREKVVANARKIWADNFGAPRCRDSERVDRGLKRPRPGDQMSEQGWLARRRAAAFLLGWQSGTRRPSRSTRLEQQTAGQAATSASMISKRIKGNEKSCRPFGTAAFCRTRFAQRWQWN